MDFREKLLEEIRELRSSVLSAGLLYRRLNVDSPAEKRQTLKVLEELAAEGKLVPAGRDTYRFPGRCTRLRGTLQGNRAGYAFLIREDGGKDVFIPRKALRGAGNGDEVIVSQSAEGGEGRVLKILSKGTPEITCVLSVRLKGGCLAVPDDGRYYSSVYIPDSARRGAGTGDRIVVRVTDPENGTDPYGEVIEVLGKAGTVSADTAAIAAGCGFSGHFPKEVLDEASSRAVPVSPEDAEGREDLRDLPTITIDGDDAKDFDDAVSIERTEDGYVLYVHIADVSHYVPEGGLVDGEAYGRGTSVYFPDRVFPMLPEALCNGMCSLREGEDRLAVTCVAELDSSGRTRSHRFVRSVVRNDRRLTYSSVEKMLRGDPEVCRKHAAFTGMITDMAELQALLSAGRRARGAVNFQSGESEFRLDKSLRVLDVRPAPFGRSNLIIEEFMILCNVLAAEDMFGAGLPFVYRVHGRPENEKIAAFRRLCSSFGYRFPAGRRITSADFQKIADEARGKPEERILDRFMLRCMRKAGYSAENSGHFGLALEYYCHFTAPIRRYPDLAAHRALKRMLAGGPTGPERERAYGRCAAAAGQGSVRESMADRAERAADSYFKTLFMEDKRGRTYDGIVSGVTESGLFVELPNTVEGFIPAETLPGGRYEFDGNYTLRGRGRSFSLGDGIRIVVSDADRELRRVRFLLYEKKR